MKIRPQIPKSGITRREFLKTAAVASAAPMIVPSSVFARPAPNDLMLFGCIGVGRQGRGDMQELIYRGLEVGARVVAVADAVTLARVAVGVGSASATCEAERGGALVAEIVSVGGIATMRVAVGSAVLETAAAAGACWE